MKTTFSVPPNHQPPDLTQRLLEISWGLVPFVFMAGIVVLSFYKLTLAAIILLVYTAGWFIRLIGYAYRLIGSYFHYRSANQIDWRAKLEELGRYEPGNKVDSLLQAVIMPVYKEPAQLIELSIKAVLASDYDPSRLMLIIAYEERGGAALERAMRNFTKKYGKGDAKVIAIKHSLVSGEVAAKAGNITHAAKWLSKYCRQHAIDPATVLVSTLDADNRPHKQYLAALAFIYATTSEPLRHSYQPLPLFTNNIWEAPAVTRLMAADTSFWFMMDGLRPRRLRLFSAYSLSLKTLEDTDYWNTESIVEDGHQYWRNYFTYQGNHHVVPIWLPIYQDAVTAENFWSAVRAQFRQLLRWAWGTADTPYVVRQALRDRSIGWWNKTVHIGRQMDDYLSWSTTPLVLAIGAWLPWVIDAARPGGHSALAFQLFHAIVGLQVVAFGDLVIAVIIYLALLPPRPAKYSRSRTVFMVLQWVLEPLTLIFFVSFSSLLAHGRLITGKSLKEFHVTTKNFS